MAENELTQEEQDEQDRKVRKKSFKKTLAAVDQALENEDGFERLAAITDEEWQAAVDAEDESV